MQPNRRNALARLNPDCTVVITRGQQGSVSKWGAALIDTAPFQIDSMDESGSSFAGAIGLHGLSEEQVEGCRRLLEGKAPARIL
jgi:hypothetical protein